jgi:hypothetical protein
MSRSTQACLAAFLSLPAVAFAQQAAAPAAPVIRFVDGIGRFIHNPNSNPPDGLAGPVIGQGQMDPEAVRGGAYAPYVVERWTKLKDSELSVYYVLSTWNPYVVVLMKSRLKVE